MTDTVVYTARRVITMNPSAPFAEAIAVRGGKILAAGSFDDVSSWGEHRVDRRFADHVLTPGFVEAHTHVLAGGLWEFPYVGYFDRRGPDGQDWPGCRNIDAVVGRLVEANELLAPGEQLVAWGLDPIYFAGERLGAIDLDRVSATRPIFVFHASGHLATVNTAMLEACEITKDTTTPGVARDSLGEPNGELQEPPAMLLARSAYSAIGRATRSDEAKWNYGFEARNSGHTTVTDLGTTQLSRPDQVAAWRSVVEDPNYPSRVMIAVSPAGGVASSEELAELCAGLRKESTAKLKFGIVKLVLDGSIQGFTARVSWPYYYRPPAGHPGNGLWLIPPEQVSEILSAYHEAGLTVHCHCNGDQAAEVFINAVEEALERHPRLDHRHTVQHSQLTTEAQYRRMGALGMCANIFSNHTFYWGDQHRDITVGPGRAAEMNACATAIREGVSFSIHSDAPITPMGHLGTAWSAVNRLTASGQVLGPHERISVMEALSAITLGAAFQLKLDAEIGSIATGKNADFAVLEEDPLEVDPLRLRDIAVWGTVLGGVPFEAGVQ